MALLLHMSAELFDLAFMYQQFSGPRRLMVAWPCLFVGGNIYAVEEQFIISVDSGKAFIQADLAVADTFYLRA